MLLLWSASAIITFSRVDLMDFYEKMSLPPEHLEQIKHFMPGNALITSAMAVWIGVFLGYMIYTKRFFNRGAGL
jgi:hypothetical protein